MSERNVHIKWMTLPEAAERLAVSQHYLRRLIKEGRLPDGIVSRPIPGGHYRVDIERFDDWVRNGCFTVPPDGGDGDGEVA